MLHAVIMAGGSGTRFWPASRNNLPKQMLDLTGEGSMLQATVARLGDLAPPSRVLIVTNERLVKPIAEQLPQLPPQSILGEPCKRDTAPCIGLAALLIARTDPSAVMAVMPSDHMIQTTQQFQHAIRLAVQLVEEQPNRLVTFGIKPTYPAEIYGYIERGEAIAAASKAGTPIYSVARFREKPKAEVAREFVDSGRFYWNAGIFVWKASTIVDALRKFEPQMLKHLETIAAAFGSPNFSSILQTEFAAIKGKSIDFAVMERAEDRVVIEAPFAWDDVGSWQSLARLRGGDEQNNTLLGRQITTNSSGCIVRTDDNHLVVTLGMKDCIVVHTPDATLVANRHDEEAIRQVVKLLEEKGWKEYL